MQREREGEKVTIKSINHNTKLHQKKAKLTMMKIIFNSYEVKNKLALNNLF